MSFAVVLAQGYQDDRLVLEETELPLRCVYYSYCVKTMIERVAFILLISGGDCLWPHPLLMNIFNEYFRPDLLLHQTRAIRDIVKVLEDADPLQVEKWHTHVDGFVLPRLTLEVSEQFTIILTTFTTTTFVLLIMCPQL